MSRDRRQILTEFLVLRVQAGDKAAFRELYDLWRAPLAGFARLRVGDADAVDDVLQEAWSGIARGLARVDDPATFPGWAHRIVARRAADWIRSQQRTRRRQSAFEADPEALAPASAGPGPREQDEHGAVRAALANLPEDQRSVLHLFYLAGMGVATIAEVLGIPRGTVKSRLFHARAQLRAQLAEPVSEPDPGENNEQPR